MRGAIAVGTSPRKYILWPAMLAFVLSYTTLYSLFSDALPYAPVPQCIDPQTTPDLFARQVLVTPPEFTDAMDDYILQGLEDLKQLAQYGVLISPLNMPLTNKSASSLLYSPKYKSHQITGAKGLLLSYIYSDKAQEQMWERKMKALVPKFDTAQFNSSTLFPSASNYDRDSIPSDFNFFPNCPMPIFTIILIYSAGALYMGMVFSDTGSVLSQAGLAVTLAVETTLAIFAALTTTSFFFPFFSHHNLRPFVALPYIVAAVATENMFRLLNATSQTPPENNPLSRVSTAVAKAVPQSIRKSLCDCLVLSIGLVPGLGLSQHARALCLFMVLGLIFDLCLHMTFFTAVLSVDLRRLELQDLLTRASIPQVDEEIQWSDQDSSLTKSLKLHLRAFVYFRRIYLKQWLPELYTALIYGSILAYLWLLSQGFISQPQAMSNPSGMFAYFLSPLSSQLPPTNRGSFLVYEPIVLYANRKVGHEPATFTLGMSLHGALTPTISDFLSRNLWVEFVATFVFVLSLTTIILKYIMPTSIEIPDEQDLANTVHFFAKDLVGYHTLDILKLVIQGSWVATVSLDHKVYVWNTVSKSEDLQPLSIPLPAQFWPVTKIAVSPQHIAIFSPDGLLFWDSHQQEMLFKVPTPQPIEAFFSKNQLVVVTVDELMVVDADGDAESIALQSNGGGVRLATRLLTPKMVEQVVFVMRDNTIQAATKHDGWEVHQVGLVESLSAMSKTDREPFYQMNKQVMSKSRVPGPIDSAKFWTSRPITLHEQVKEIIPVPELHMVMLASGLTVSLLDVQTGTIMKHLQVGSFKPRSLRVFHSQPTYCRFCGSMSVESISVAYSDGENDGLVICHTLVIENRARNNICLRAERDPRETRCLGFEATNEDQHWLDNVEGWDTTDMNMIMGVRRKESLSNDLSLSSGSDDGMPASTSTSTSTSTSIFSSTVKPRKRAVKRQPINIRWEGWVMSATGQVSYYDIPDVTGGQTRHTSYATRLLIHRVGPVVKYGRKSIAVAFGNIIKILYFGNEEAFLSDVEDSYLVNKSKRWPRGY